MDESKIKLIEKWLSLFGNPGVFILHDNEGAKGQLSINKYRGLTNSLEINSQKDYGVFFNPNGNTGNVNVEGEMIRRKDTDCEQYISCCYVDIDIKLMSSEMKLKSRNDIEKYIKGVIEAGDFRAQYIVKSGGGYHLYSFIDEGSRYELGKAIGKEGRKTLQLSLASIFDGGDTASHSINKVMRLPFSLHRKNIGNPFEVELFKVIKNEAGKIDFLKVTKPEEITLEGYALANASGVLEFVENQKDIKISTTKGTAVVQNNTAEAINKLDILKIVEALEKYPRTNANGEEVVYKTDGFRIWFVINGRRVLTDGYKVNRSKNYIHNFSMDMHGKEERPRGPVFPFLYSYFNKDLQKMGDFLEAEFGINFIGDGENTFLKITTDNGIILFNNDGVYYRTTKVKGKTTEDANEKLFDSPFMIKGFVKTSFDKKGETENKNMYIVISLLDRDEDEPDEMVIEVLSSVQKFNDTYQKRGLTFMKSDAYLRDFYTGVKRAARAGIIKRLDFYYLNGYYPNFYLEGDRMYSKQGDIIDTKGLPIMLQTQTVEHCQIRKEVTMSEYGEKLRKIFIDSESMLSFTTYIALAMGDKFWNDLLDGDEMQIIIPGLILAGHTKAGKTTMVNMLLNGFGLSSLAKKKSVKGTTLQPLKQMATDDFVMHREEFTGEIGQEKENLIRDVLNKTRTARGLLDGSNSEYIYRASLILDGERLPESESVVNRCVAVPFTPKGRIGTQKLLRDFQGVGYKKDFIKQLYSIDLGNVKNDFIKAQDALLDAGIPDRYSMIYAFLVCVNRWFSIYFEDELINVIKENLDEHDKVDAGMTPLATIISDLTQRYRTKLSYTPDGRDGYIIKVVIPGEYRAQHKVDIMEVMSKYGKKRVEMNASTLVFKILSKAFDDSEERDELYNIMVVYRDFLSLSNPTDINGADKDL